VASVISLINKSVGTVPPLPSQLDISESITVKGVAPGQPRSSVISKLPEVAPAGTVTSISVADILFTVATKPLKEAAAVAKLVPVIVTIVPSGPEDGNAEIAFATHNPLPVTVNV